MSDNLLSDGTCIPSYLGVQSRGGAPGSTAMLNEYVLRIGEVKRIIYPKQDLHYGSKSIEYEVEIQHRDGNGGATTATFRGATVSTMFGGLADRFNATLRPDASKSGDGQQSNNETLGIGSKVLLLCPNGDQQKAIILGGIEDQRSTRVDKSEDGHHLFFEFNGIRFTIDKEGQGTLTFRGATKYDGTLTDEAVAEAEGTNLNFDKEGNVKVATKDDAQFIKINHKDKKIEILADKEWSVTVNDKMTVQVQNDINVSTSAGKMSLGAAGNVNINSAGVLVGGATDAWVKGTTYRNAESQLHSQMVSTFSALSTALTTASVSLTTAVPLNAIPVIGGTLAAAPLAAAAVALQTTGPLMASLAGYLATFEAQGLTYLSLKNKTD